mmetsp:Transcript_72377/g.183119  ORF Transcript_72377/g.183119 Transcript_72377/m.183119 type:complete len:203 (+) Transcript_72377:99-707(+)
MLAGSPDTQWEWHEAHRDQVKNMYRTSYTDMAHSRETYVKSDFPAGYGGHVASVRHEVLHRNTGFDRQQALMRTDPSRDAFPSFNVEISGLPTSTAFPCGAKKNPTYQVVPHSGSTTNPRAPWGLLSGGVEGLNQRFVPATVKHNASAPSLVYAGSQMASPARETQSSPDNRLNQTVSRANAEAARGHMPTEAEMLVGEMGC